ncbi:hypothetical protein QBC41DRAFT_344828 [Cercophora samala]|uniref:Mis18 domain-containing protein n=1 Tax=Cercophora samala TaxID=330535 RepID=A0AA40DDK4_9PEZI|nr:hypothetical protein QBC41DRAFT_344828 [Cercophora samala]
MKTVSCKCKKCQRAVGIFSNLWIQVGKSYLGPVVEPDGELAIRCEGKLRMGDTGTLVEGCHLQNFICDSCAAVLGFRCIQTPVNHVFDDNQVLLRIASVILLDTEGDDIELEIKRVLNINEPSKTNTDGVPDPSSNFPGTVEFQQLKFDLEGQKEYLKRIDNNGFKIVAGLDKRVGRIEIDVKTLHATVGGFKEGIRGVQEGLKSVKSELDGFAKSGTEKRAAFKSLESQLSSINGSLETIQHQAAGLTEEMRKEVSDLKNRLQETIEELDMLRSEINESISADSHARDMAAIRTEIAQLRRELRSVRTGESDRVVPSFPSRELEILTSNIAKIGNRASQVETLQMEFEILKGRVDRAEANREASHSRRVTYPLDPETLLPNSVTRKRASSPKLETVSKRTLSSNQFTDSTVAGYSALPLTPSSQNSTMNLQNPKKRGRPRATTASSNTKDRL